MARSASRSISRSAQRSRTSVRARTRATVCDSLESRLLFSANSDYVTHLYRVLLNRAPDAPGLAYYEAKLAGGDSLDDVVNRIRNSPEALTSEISGLYGRFLDRAPDSAGLTYWINKAQQQHLSAGALVVDFAASSEEYLGDQSGDRFVKQLYEIDLGRDPSQADLTFWEGNIWFATPLIDSLPGGPVNPYLYAQRIRTTAANEIAGSAEARQHLITMDYQNYLGRAPANQDLSFWIGPAAPTDVQLDVLTATEFAGVAGIHGTEPVPITAAATTPWTAAGASNALTTDLLNALAPGNPNLVLSGYSAEAALAMAYEGAAGNTAAQMSQVLHLPDDSATSIITPFSQLAADLMSTSAGDLQIANSLWVQQGYPLLASFTDAVQQMASAGLHQADFINQTEAARAAINAWVSEQTQAMIPELLPQGALTSDTRLALVNALTLNAKWANQFDPTDTHAASFATESNGKLAQATVQMMSQDNTFQYLDTSDFQAVEMPYANDNLSMLVFLPTANAADPLAPLTALEQQFTPQNLTTWTGEMQSTDLNLQIPRFSISSTLPLTSTLSTLGMTDAFTPDKANFSGITSAPDFSISTVLQKAVIQVGEQGTKAAAATVVVGVTVSVRVETPTPSSTFRADHPFLFAIRDNTTGALLFTGQVANPILTS